MDPGKASLVLAQRPRIGKLISRHYLRLENVPKGRSWPPKRAHTSAYSFDLWGLRTVS
jgi:hypothetical protein